MLDIYKTKKYLGQFFIKFNIQKFSKFSQHKKSSIKNVSIKNISATISNSSTNRNLTISKNAEQLADTKTDPRNYQICVLSCLLVIGSLSLKFNLELSQVLLTFAVTLLSQWGFTKIFRLNKFEYKSALITTLSLCLLLKTSNPLIGGFAAFIAIASKFFFRWNQKHIFNPANFALVLAVLLTQQAWISSGQWGNFTLLAFFIFCIGGMVVVKSLRSDVALTFLFVYLSLLLLRKMWLGDPWAIYFHQIQNGALLIFTFFMISDPKTSPNSKSGRVVFAVLVALLAFIYQYAFFINNGPIWSLVSLAIFVPFIDYLMPGNIYKWPSIENIYKTTSTIAK